jgi:hypothetical protein
MCLHRSDRLTNQSHLISARPSSTTNRGGGHFSALALYRLLAHEEKAGLLVTAVAEPEDIVFIVLDMTFSA